MSDRPVLVVVGKAPASLLDRLDALSDAADVRHAADPADARELLGEEPEPSVAAPLMLRRVSAELGRIHHDVNNPLAIIAGNAQLLVEIAKATDADEMLLQPMEDIVAASEQLTAVHRRLLELRDRLKGA